MTSGHASARRVTPPPQNAFEFESSIVLNTADLLRWENWKAPSRAFLASVDDTIDIDDIASDYAGLLAGFHAWFRSALLERHGESFSEFRSRAAEVDARWRKAWGEPVEDPSGNSLG